MATRICRQCAARCYILPLSCVFDLSSIFRRDAPIDERGLLGLMERAQATTLTSLSSAECLANVCADILAYEDDGTAIPDASQAFIDAAAPVLVAKMEHLWMGRHGAGKATSDGVRAAQGFDAKAYTAQLNFYASELAEASRAFTAFLEANRADYPCLPAPPDPCEGPDDDDYGLPSFLPTPRGGGDLRWDFP